MLAWAPRGAFSLQRRSSFRKQSGICYSRTACASPPKRPLPPGLCQLPRPSRARAGERSYKADVRLSEPSLVYFAVTEAGSNFTPSADDVRNAKFQDSDAFTACGSAVGSEGDAALMVQGWWQAETQRECVVANLDRRARCGSCPLVVPGSNYTLHLVVDSLECDGCGSKKYELRARVEAELVFFVVGMGNRDANVALCSVGA